MGEKVVMVKRIHSLAADTSRGGFATGSDRSGSGLCSSSLPSLCPEQIHCCGPFAETMLGLLLCDRLEWGGGKGVTVALSPALPQH